MLNALLLIAALLPDLKSACPDPSPEPVLAGVNGVTLPTIVGQKTAPDYPAEARSRSLGGKVMLSAVICPDGKVYDVVVLEGIPWARSLDEAAARAVRSWVYQPALHNGKPVPVYMTVGVDFDVSPHPTSWARSVVNLRLHTTLDRALAKLEKVGFKIKYTGSSPPVLRTYEETSVQAVLDDLAERYRLTMELVSPGKLRVTGLPGPETEGLVAPVLETRGEAALPATLHGRVGLNLVVLDDGTVDRATVVHPSGDEKLDRAASETARQWKFRPATLAGRAVASYLPVIVEQ
ncbi:MAG TPA: energy transducer TonB [Candidatus Polarisedimenticolaceae bacterium]|nr:energy transducer TonB [Candidatus Polarisedimenticolaceae bacterium]